MNHNNPKWRKSTRSGNNGGACVEVAALPADVIGVRDSKDPDGGHHAFDPAVWAAFTAHVKAGQHDL